MVRSPSFEHVEILFGRPLSRTLLRPLGSCMHQIGFLPPPSHDAHSTLPPRSALLHTHHPSPPPTVGPEETGVLGHSFFLDLVTKPRAAVHAQNTMEAVTSTRARLSRDWGLHQRWSVCGTQRDGGVRQKESQSRQPSHRMNILFELGSYNIISFDTTGPESIWRCRVRAKEHEHFDDAAGRDRPTRAYWTAPEAYAYIVDQALMAIIQTTAPAGE
jgi:hypothetical protein